jgi:hypothetical protein
MRSRRFCQKPRRSEMRKMAAWYMPILTGRGNGREVWPKLAACGLVLLFACAMGLAQQSAGTILGTVSDPSGAKVAGVHITLTNEGTQDIRESTTDQLGDYRFAFVPPASYSVKAEAKGFQAVTVSQLVLNVNDERRQDFTLEDIGEWGVDYGR